VKPLIEHTLALVRSQTRRPTDADALQAEDAAVITRIVSGEDGDRLLEILAKLTVLRPALDPSLSGAASHDYAQRRTGENGVFAALIHLIDVHDHLTRKDHAPANPDDPELRPVFGWVDAPGLSTGGSERYGDAADPGSGDTAGGLRFDPGGTVAVG
jgi:hypothetical protein